MNFRLCLLCILNVYFCLFPLRGNQTLIPVRILSDSAKQKLDVTGRVRLPSMSEIYILYRSEINCLTVSKYKKNFKFQTFSNPQSCFVPSSLSVFFVRHVSSAGRQLRWIVDETPKLIRQVSLVFWQKAAHFYSQEFSGNVLHDGSCRLHMQNISHFK